MPPPLQGKQRRRSISMHVTAEQYEILLELQEVDTRRPSITRLAREAFERGLVLPTANY